MWVIRTLRVPHDVLKEHLSSLWIQQCMRQLFKVDTVTISTTTSRSLNRLYVTTFKLTRSPSVQRRVMLKLIRLSCGVRVRFVFFLHPLHQLQWHNFSRGKEHCACIFFQTSSEALETLTKIFGNTLFACALKPVWNLLTEWSPLLKQLWNFPATPHFTNSYLSFIFWTYCGIMEAKSFNVHTNSYPHIGTRRGGRKGVMEPLLRVFDLLQYFETILPSVESLWSSQKDEVYFIGGGAIEGLWRHQQCPRSWVLTRIRNQVKIASSGNFFVFDI